MTGGARGGLRLPAQAAAAELAAPGTEERFSPLTGAAWLALEFDARGLGEPSRGLRNRLAGLACPTVGVCPDPPASAQDPGCAVLIDCLDVLVPNAAELAKVADRIERTPLAALALVQLLRLGERLEIHQALIAESLAYSTLQGGPEFARWLAGRVGPGLPSRESSQDRTVRMERTAGRLEIVLCRPERHNALSVNMRDQLAEALSLAHLDDEVQEIVLRGEGASFCSGGDLDEFGTLPDPATAHAVRSTRSPARLAAACAGRLEARVHGACVGAGVELPAFARRVVAARDSLFQLPELSMGLVPGSGGTASLPRRIGRQRTAWLALTGEKVDAETALSWGLVDRIE